MKELKQTLLVSAELIETLGSGHRAAFADLGVQTLKGKHETVRVYGFKG